MISWFFPWNLFIFFYFFFISFCMNSIISMICRCNPEFYCIIASFLLSFYVVCHCIMCSCTWQENVRKQNSLFFRKYFHFLSLLPVKMLLFSPRTITVTPDPVSFSGNAFYGSGNRNSHNRRSSHNKSLYQSPNSFHVQGNYQTIKN